MTGADRVSEAVAELYSADPDAFTERRADLAARARAAGEASAAKAIAGLRKPTRSAWAVNQVVRADPSVPSRLAALGDELRAAESALDGATIRELSVARRQLIDALVAQALAASGQHPPSAALREEVTATFAAALADPQLIAQMAAGTLVRVERRAGVVSGAVPVLSVAPSPAARRPAPATGATAPAKAPAQAPGAEAPTAKSISRSAAEAPAARVAARSAAEAATARSAARSAARAAAAAAARAEAERERRQAIADAERAVTDADRAVFRAGQAEQEQDSAVRLVEEQLAEASQRLSEARRHRRQAESAQRKARQVLARLTQ